MTDQTKRDFLLLVVEITTLLACNGSFGDRVFAALVLATQI
jgi:hypothetical protein